MRSFRLAHRADTYHPTFAALATALCLFAWKVLFSSHRLRPDIWIAAACAFLLWLYVEHTARYFWLGFAAGALLNIHLPVLFLSVATVALVGVELLNRRISMGAVVRFSLGLLLGVGVWAILTFLPDPARTLHQLTVGPPAIPPVKLAEGDYALGQRLANFGYVASLGYLQATRFGWLEVAAIAIAVVCLVVSGRSKYDQAQLVFVLAVYGAMAVSTYLQYYYFVIIVPALSLLMARAAERLTGSVAGWAGFALVAPLLLAYIGGNLLLTWNSRSISYPRYVSLVQAVVPPGASILADGSLWFEFSEHPFVQDYYLLLAPESDQAPPEQWVEQVLRARRVTIVMRSERMATWFPGPPLEKEVLFNDALLRILTRRCSQRAVVADLFWGVDVGGPAVKRTEVWECPG